MKLSRKGQSMVEFALVLPMLIVLLVGIFEFGQIFNAYLQINHASREGARTGALRGTDTEIVQTVSDSSPTLDSTLMTVTITPNESSRTRGESVEVQVEYDYHVVIGLIGDIISNNVNLTTQTTMRIE
jgi:Flp pilus assembly protein TadG